MLRHTTGRRDAALHRMRRVNRWLIASTVGLTGLFAELAIHAFPGRTVAATTDSQAAAGTSVAGHVRHRRGRERRLQAPAQAPQSAAVSSAAQAAATPTRAPATTTQVTPTVQQPAAPSTPAGPQPAAVTQVPASPPVVSGGS